MDSSSTAGPSSGRTGPSDTSGSGDPQAGGKRTADDRGSLLEDRPQAAKKSRKGGKKKQKPKQFHLTKEQVPKEFLGLKVRKPCVSPFFLYLTCAQHRIAFFFMDISRT
jgi:hypothetical protein